MSVPCPIWDKSRPCVALKWGCVGKKSCNVAESVHTVIGDVQRK